MTAPARTFGTVRWASGAWRVACEPHVMIRLKRVFERAAKGQHGEVALADSPEVGRELLWFLDRYPMQLAAQDLFRLERQALAHRATETAVANVLGDGYVPRAFELAVPARDYQRLAADLALQTGRLLLADDVGLGKTASAICALTDPRTRPALVVTLAHLPRQWALELARFAPDLRVHIVRSGKPYDLTKERRRTVPFPDVVVMNYHKLAGWADTLGPLVRSVVFDECQELRHSDSSKYAAARYLAGRAGLRLGLSATPIYNYGGEVHSVLNVLAPGALGTEVEFAREWCAGAHVGEKARIADPRAFGAWLRAQGLMLRRTRTEVGRELPPLTRVPHAVDADLGAIDRVAPRVAELARVILAQGSAVRGAKLQATEELSWRLRQATGLAKAPYVAAFVRLLVESGEKVVLFGWHREVYSVWQEALADLSPVLYTGTESSAQKDAARRAFVEGDARVLIMSLRAGAGLDGLQRACRTVVFGELDWSPGVHEQCAGRVFRDGQPDPVVAYFLLADVGSDPIVADVLGIKRAQIEGLRDPASAPLEALDPGERHLKRLAEDFLARHGQVA